LFDGVAVIFVGQMKKNARWLSD